ncbi:MAG TPA: hypothetical protein VKH20_07525 [Solirubrobacterales bacterium]|nr:hypothetical protein [Solirubrobacterales bacterium]
MRRKRGVAAAASALIALLSIVSGAGAELTEQGNLFVRFQGGIDPVALPRAQRAAITVSVAGTVKTLSGERPPALREIEIELNRGGELNSNGLPVCRYGQLVAVVPAKALKACGGALVGEGSYAAKTAFPEQSTFPSDGHILAFNGFYRGREVILAHVYGTSPVPITRIIVFYVHRHGGTYGTVIKGSLPDAVNHYGYVVEIALRLHRIYTYRGQRRSYLSAACEAPSGFTVATFPFARASMAFADGRTLASTLTRSCKVSG